MILTVLFFALILLSTSVLAINFNSLFTSLFDYFFPSSPKIISAKVEPVKVEPSDWMEIIAEVEDKYGVKSVFADMASIEKVELKLVYGDEKKGIWKGKWFVHSIEVGKSYNATIVAINERGKTSSVNVEFHDDPIFCCRRMVNITGIQGWIYRRPITINNTQNSNTLTDYQVLVTLDTESLISAGKMRSDCGDIRFTDSDGGTLLSYWIESGCNTTNTKIWVKVPEIPASSTKTIYVYYGNSDATTTSSGTSTFLFFDDFEDADISDWSQTNLYGTVSYSVVSNNVSYVVKQGPSSYTSGYRYKNISVSGWDGYAVDFDIYVGSYGAGSTQEGFQGLGLAFFDTANNYLGTVSAGMSNFINDDGASGDFFQTWNTYGTPADTCCVINPNNYYRDLRYHDGHSTGYWIRNVRVYNSSFSNVGKIMIALRHVDGSGVNDWSYFDNIRVRKYTSPEPTTITGNEELLPIALVTLDTASLISQGKMRNDCGDIRFTDSRSFDAALWTRNFSYQLVSGCNSTNTLFRVNVIPISPITIGKTFYVYYGNSEVTSASTSITVGLGNSTTTLLPEETWIRISGGTENLLITGGGGNLTIK